MWNTVLIFLNILIKAFVKVDTFTVLLNLHLIFFSWWTDLDLQMFWDFLSGSQQYFLIVYLLKLANWMRQLYGCIWMHQVSLSLTRILQISVTILLRNTLIDLTYQFSKCSSKLVRIFQKFGPYKKTILFTQKKAHRADQTVTLYAFDVSI